ncbi:MBL fold metallo-hydrolase [Xanthobacter sp. TB0136]|uniref:MBL fold metallo-hydrolase n=1 Tax=Xanthobacter sp. TB0136 TaxID=3459177 RepID=UPI004039CD9F
MSAEIAFQRDFDAPAGRVDQITPLVRRIVAPNPSPFTYTGTCSYIIGQGKVAILDPGPDSAAHIEALLHAVRGEEVTHIVATHTHHDHTPAAPAIQARTGARTVGAGPHIAARPLYIGEVNPLDASADTDFHPDIILADGDAITGPGWTLQAIATPGHTANHLAFALPENQLLFSGDHVMAWATSIVAPPDGSMGDYIRSLEILGARPEKIYLPGHGGPVREAPSFVRDYLDHRLARQAAILRSLNRAPETIPDLVRRIYIGLDPRLFDAASLTVLAHLEYLVERNEVFTEGPPSMAGLYRLTR